MLRDATEYIYRINPTTLKILNVSTIRWMKIGNKIRNMSLDIGLTKLYYSVGKRLQSFSSSPWIKWIRSGLIQQNTDMVPFCRFFFSNLMNIFGENSCRRFFFFFYYPVHNSWNVKLHKFYSCCVHCQWPSSI